MISPIRRFRTLPSIDSNGILITIVLAFPRFEAIPAGNPVSENLMIIEESDNPDCESTSGFSTIYVFSFRVLL